MRGGPPRGSMKLDNRPKKLLVKGVNTDQVQAVKEWYEVCVCRYCRLVNTSLTMP